MEEGGGEIGKFPIGFRFKPREDELVEFYLLPRLQGRPTVRNYSVVEANVYEHHPDTLTRAHRGGEEEEWYFLSSRQRMYGNGVRPARKTLDGRGRWKASTATKEVAEEVVVCDGRVRFCKSVLNYFEGNPKKETRTKWIMLELTVPEYEIKLDKPGAKNMLDEYVMCKIYVSPQYKKKGDDDEGTSSAFEEGEDEASSSSTPHGQGGAAESSMLAEKRTGGKRPLFEQPPQRGSFFAPAQKRARHQGSLSIGSTTQASYSAATSSNNAASSMQSYNGGPGRLLDAHRGLQFQAPPPTQRPAGAHTNGQAPGKPPAAGACGGGRLVQMPTMTPVLYQPFAVQAEGDPFGQMAATMTTRPPTTGSASQAARLQSFPGSQPPRHPGTAFRPHVSLQCCYDQNYRPAQVQQPPPGHASSSSQQQRLPAAFQPRQQMQRPFLNGGADRRGVVAAVPPGQYFNGYAYQRSSLAPADGQGGAANERNGAARFNANAEQFFVDLATINPSLAAEGFTQPSPAPAPSRPIESPAPAAAGVGEVQTETGETSGLNTQDAA